MPPSPCKKGGFEYNAHPLLSSQAQKQRRKKQYRSIAQLGRALPSGGRGRRFESCYSDQRIQLKPPLTDHAGWRFFIARIFLLISYPVLNHASRSSTIFYLRATESPQGKAEQRIARYQGCSGRRLEKAAGKEASRNSARPFGRAFAILKPPLLQPNWRLLR